MRNTVGMLGTHVCFFAFNLFVSVFLTAKLFTITGGNIASVALFYIVFYIGIFVFFWGSSYLVKRFSRVLFLRISTLLLVGQICLILFLQDHLAQLYMLFAAVGGIAQGIYWASMHLLEGEIMGGDKMKKFMSWFYIMDCGAKIIFPFTLGAIIDYVSFFAAAIITFGIGVLLIVFSLLIKADYKRQHMSLRNFIKTAKAEKILRPVMINLWINFLWGFICLSTMCVTILTMTVFVDDNANAMLGMFTTIFAAAAIILIFAYRLIKPKPAQIAIIFITCLLPLLLSMGLLFEISLVTLLLFQLGYGAICVIPKKVTSTLSVNIPVRLNCPQFVAENNVLSEMFLFCGRILGLGIIALAHFTDPYVFQVMVVVLLFCNFLTFFLIRSLYNRYNVN